MFLPHRKHTYRHPQPVTGITLFSYVNYVLTSQETHLWAATRCYGIAVLYCMEIVFVPHREHTYRPPRPVTRVSLRFRTVTKRWKSNYVRTRTDNSDSICCKLIGHLRVATKDPELGSKGRHFGECWHSPNCP
jgi:hypothetical protein